MPTARRPAPSLPVALLALLGSLLGCAGEAARGVLLATTTSVHDTGLLDSLLPAFERRCGCEVKSVAVGSGQALALAARGEADVVIAHAPELEERYVAAGELTDRRPLLSNDFVLVGPADDPAGIAGLGLAEAMRRLARGRVPFVSRADSSGTHLVELRLWRAAGARPRGDWYLESGQGMAATLRLASERGAYAITDRATFVTLAPSLALRIVLEGEPDLRNVYHVLRPDPRRHPRVNVEGGRALAGFLVSPEAQGLIAGFGRARFGAPLFRPAH
ncbi:MAG TPA: substrate-binding domain-containing protein [Gemmatimonadales bacterium]|nr:substrate-binding domain-containing protein [Gemmatimonadales bacterium]